MDLRTNGPELLYRCGATSKKIGVEINGSLEFEQWLIRFDKRMIGKRHGQVLGQRVGTAFPLFSHIHTTQQTDLKL